MSQGRLLQIIAKRRHLVNDLHQLHQLQLNILKLSLLNLLIFYFGGQQPVFCMHYYHLTMDVFACTKCITAMHCV